MLDVEQFREYMVSPTLEYLGMGGEAAERLMLGTALTESKLTYLKQIGGGPALGLFQMEPFTHNDIWNNYINYAPVLRDKIQALLAPGSRQKQLIGNLPYACAMARLLYWRIPAKLPDADDCEGMAAYWKKYYNTRLGKGKPEHFINAAKGLFI